MANGFAFVSHDGEDENGVRAEVYVQRGTGKIHRIDPSEKGNVAQVEIKTDGLRFAQKAWVKIDSEVYKIAQKAYDAGEDVEYRIESQRKPGEDRSTPIEEFRKDSAVAQKSTKSILAGLNGKLSDEAVTHPSEDKGAGGRIPAQPRNNAAPATPAPQQGTTQHRPNSRSATEAPPYARMNDDGTLNAGSYGVQAAVGVEGFVRNNLLACGWDPEAEGFEQEVFGYSMALLDIADTIQKYCTKKDSSRMATSHTRVRAVMFDSVEHFLKFSLIKEEKETRESWYKKVGSMTLKRFQMVLELDNPARDPQTKVRAFDVDAFLGKAKPQQSAPQHSPQDDEAAKAVRPKPRTEAPSQQETPAAPASEEANEEANLSGLKNMSKVNFSLYPANHVEPFTGEIDKSIISGLSDLIEETGIEKRDLGTLLRYTFGQGLVKDIDPELLGDFMDFYIGAESESEGNLKKVVEHIEKAG